MNHAQIFLVDDDLEDQEIMKDAFEDAGISSVSYFNDGYAVLRKLNSITGNFPQLVVVDINMPKMSGLVLLELIRRDPRFSAIRVIVLSTAEKKQYRELCDSLGAHEFIQKPSTYKGMKELAKHLYEVQIKSPNT